MPPLSPTDPPRPAATVPPRPAATVPGRPAATVPGRLLLLIAVVAAVVGGLLTLSFSYADHAPAPHGIRVAVVAPASARARVATSLDHAAPGGFDVVGARSAQAATAALRDQRIRGALVLGSGRHAEVLTAAAAGLTLQQVVTAALSDVAGAAGAHASTRDVVPVTAGDSSGLLSFVFQLGLLVPSVIGSVALYLVGRRNRLWWRIAAAWLFSVLVAALGTLIVATVFGGLTGAWLPLFGIGVLGALAFVLAISAAQATLGLPATGLMALLLIFLGNAISGGSVPTGMLPDVYRQVSPWLPNGAIVHAVRAVVYFGGHGLGQPLLALALWAAVAFVVLIGNDLLHAVQLRRDPDRASEIYATPGLVNVARITRRHRTASDPAPAA